MEEFNRNGKLLTIVGTGILENELRSIAKANITFKGFIANEELSVIYAAHDIFILPSRSEPWGLVVDEAIFHGLPVVVSDRVGCSIDLVEKPSTGVIFNLDNQERFIVALDEVEKNYDQYKKCVELVDFDRRDELQVKAYIDLINN